ncbi:MAG: hypothetical protein ABEJ61_11590 [Haloferacaceae archaeon]
MNWPSREQILELRRALPLIAAALFVAALFFPMWIIEVHAVQYPDEILYLRLYAYPRIAGDYVEMARLNHYIGFYYPDPVYWTPNFDVNPDAIDVPEWSFGWIAFVVVSALSIVVAVAPTTAKLKRGLKWQLVGTVGVFTIMLADIQYRLYQAGHTLDPDAPVMGVSGFTPPLWGRYEVANITSYSYFGAGAFMAMLACLLLAVAYYVRGSPVTFGDLRTRARRRVTGEELSPSRRDEQSIEKGAK